MSESVTSKSKPGAAPTPANERILVVDSDDNIRGLVVWNLSADYVVSSAATADDALDLDLGGFSLISSTPNCAEPSADTALSQPCATTPPPAQFPL